MKKNKEENNSSNQENLKNDQKSESSLNKTLGFKSTKPRFDYELPIYSPTRLYEIYARNEVIMEENSFHVVRKKVNIPFNSTSTKFKSGPTNYKQISCTGEHIGPGYYKIDGNLVKQTFNWNGHSPSFASSIPK